MECKLPDITVHYEEYGEGMPILMLHGYTPDHRLMTGCMEPIMSERRGWRRIYLDLPGMGKTRGEQWITSSDQMLDVVLQFIDQVLPGQRFLVAGESYGGYLAQGIVYWRPEMVDGLFLLCSVVIARHADREVPPPTVLVENPALMASLSTADAEEFGSMAVVQDETGWQRFRNEIMPGLAAADQPFLAKVREQFEFSFDVITPAMTFEAPTLILAGRQDASVGYRDAWRILEQYPRATFAVLDRAGHNLQIEQATLFSVLMSEWLDRVEEYIRLRG